MRKATTFLTILASFVFYAVALATPASADPNAPGNNGTVKVHDADTAVDDMRNEPHVCRFYIDGFTFDDRSAGQWWIQSWPPTGNGTEVLRASWTADGRGDWHSGVQTLPAGHYKLYAKQENAATPGGDKQKVFWVECAARPTPTPTVTPSATAAGTSSTTTSGAITSSGGTTTTTSGGTTTIVGGTTTVVGGTTTITASGGTTTTITGGTTTISGGTTTISGNSTSNVGGTTTNSGGTPSTGVLGFQSGPGGVGAVSPTIELPGGSTQQAPNSADTGVAAGAVAGVQSLPSTSTDGGPMIPLAMMGLGLMALGGALLRREGLRL